MNDREPDTQKKMTFCVSGFLGSKIIGNTYISDGGIIWRNCIIFFQFIYGNF